MARRHFKAGALTAPLPAVLVTVGDGNESNIITIGWTGILSTHPARTYISVRPERYSYQLLKRTGEFVINLSSAKMARQVDYAGIYTGAKVDKFKECGFTAVESREVSCPTIEESPLSLECRVVEVIPMGTHDVFIADILSVSADERILDADGRICFDRAGLLAYAHGEYFALGEKLGAFGFSTKKTKKNTAKSDTGKPKTEKKTESKAEKGQNGSRKTSDEPRSAHDGRDGQQKGGKRPFYLDAPRGKSKKRGQKK